LKIRDSIAALVDTFNTAAATIFESHTEQRLTGIFKLKPRVKQGHNQDNLSDAICATYRQDGGLFRRSSAGLGCQLRSKVPDPKETSDARDRFNSTVQIDVAARNVQLVLEGTDQLDQTAMLGWRRLSKVEVTDQADADAVAIDVIRSRCEPGHKLLRPSLADLNLAISAAITVANDEMVSQPTGRFRQALRATRHGSAVMNINIVPPPWIEWHAGRIKQSVKCLRGVYGKEALACLRSKRRGSQGQQ